MSLLKAAAALPAQDLKGGMVQDSFASNVFNGNLRAVYLGEGGDPIPPLTNREKARTTKTVSRSIA
jgi:hypothetical protein